MPHTRETWLALVFLLAIATPALAAMPTRCTTYEEKTLGRLYTLCDDGTWSVSTWNKTLERWETTVTPPPSSSQTKR